MISQLLDSKTLPWLTIPITQPQTPTQGHPGMYMKNFLLTFVLPIDNEDWYSVNHMVFVSKTATSSEDNSNNNYFANIP